jgi:peptidyl-prolyl cis-trans isomerase B (cyclophilin B)
VYTTLGGAPHLDQNYTVFGEVVQGLAVIDSIAAVATSGSQGGDKPLQNVTIIKARLVKRK